MKKLFVFVIFTILFAVCNTYAGEPFTILKGKIDHVFSVLNDPAYSDGTKKDEQREILWKTIENAFDFNVMSRLTLANNWKSFTAEQQDEFARVFGRFLGNTYLDKIQSGFSGQQVEYDGEDILSEKKAVVMTNIIRNGVKTPMDYSMLNTGNTWKIYDVKIEGVSLLKNYRTQFRSILLKDKPEDLIEMLKEKIKK